MPESVKVLTGNTHELKCWPKFFEAIRRGDKTWEIRPGDRDYRPGDTLLLLEFDPRNYGYTGRELERRVVWVTSFDALPSLAGFVGMTLEAPEVVPQAELDRLRAAGDELYENAEAALTAAHDELIQAWIRSRLDDPGTVERVAKVIALRLRMIGPDRTPYDRVVLWETNAPGWGEWDRDQMRAHARAAISALAEPEDV